MVKEKINVGEVYASLHQTTSEFLRLVSSFDDQEINAIPYAGSWTAAQVGEHVTLSNKGIAKHLAKPGTIALREPDTGVENIKSIFLNFDKKLNSPEFIVPTKQQYDKAAVVAELADSIDLVETEAQKRDPFEIVPHAIFGEITRLETLHFVISHTQRHIHQLKKIRSSIQNEAKMT